MVLTQHLQPLHNLHHYLHPRWQPQLALLQEQPAHHLLDLALPVPMCLVQGHEHDTISLEKYVAQTQTAFHLLLAWKLLKLFCSQSISTQL